MYYTCPKLSSTPRINHGFFTINGGSSEDIYSSLNCGYNSGDDLKKVDKNRALVAKKMGGVLCTVNQIHSPDTVIVTTPWEHKSAPQADALITNKPNIILGILTADCIPILFADKKNHIIAAAHAGWKGALSGVIENTVKSMQSLGADISSIIATIGPCIGQSSYEVDIEFLEPFLEQSSNNSRFFTSSPSPKQNKNSKYLFDLAGYAKHQLSSTGISQINIIEQDTYLNHNEFFSYRRSCKQKQKSYGRQISTIMLKANA